MIRLSTAIMSHPARQHRAEWLKATHEVLSAVVVLDPAPQDAPCATRTARRAWEACGDGATHHLVLQDDVTLCTGFQQRLGALIASEPRRVISLYTDWSGHSGQMLRISALNGFSLFQSIGEAVSAVAVVMPSDIARGYADFLNRTAELHGRDSRLLMDYLISIGETPYACAPTLVQHDVPYTPSIWPSGISKGVRRSACFLDDAGSSLATTAPFTSPDEIPYLDGATGSAVHLRASAGWRSWSETPLLDLFGDLGVSANELVDGFNSHLLKTDGQLSTLLGRAILFEAWLSTRALVALNGPIPVCGSPVARVALATLLPGALRRVLSESQLALAACLTAPMLEMAIEEPL